MKFKIEKEKKIGIGIGKLEKKPTNNLNDFWFEKNRAHHDVMIA